MKAFQKLLGLTVVLLLLSVVLGLKAPLRCALHAAASPALVLKGAKIYPSPEAEVIANGVMILRNGKIESVGKLGSVKIPGDATINDCTGMVVTAGFQNSHVHFIEPKWNHAGTQPADRLSAQLITMFTIYGFTTVVDTGSMFGNTSKLRARIESGEVIGPRIITPVAMLFPPNGLPIYLHGFKNATGWAPDEPATPEEAVAIIRRNKNAESKDILKLFTGSIVTYEATKPMALEVARAAAVEAHREGRLVWAHPTNIQGVEIARDAGVEVLAHTTSAPGSWSYELVESLVQRKMALIPTLKLWKYVTEGAPDPSLGEHMVEGGVEQVREFSRAGGRVMFGTDVGFMQGYDPSDEYVYMGRALTPMQILAALTTAPAAEFQEENRRGRVVTGMDADLVVLGSDPAEDVHNFTDVRYTIRQGRVIYPLMNASK